MNVKSGKYIEAVARGLFTSQPGEVMPVALPLE
jgi:hypothetical protein